jgi:hypothetical protein
MSKQLETTQVTIDPMRPTDPRKLLCYASIVLCGCFEVGVFLRAYRNWLDTNAAQGRYDEVLVKELAS